MNRALRSTTGSRARRWGPTPPATPGEASLRARICFKIRAYNSAGSSSWYPNVSPWYVCATTKVSSCPTALVVGVHGVGEGPSPTISAVSTTLQDTYNAFVTAAKQQGHTGENFDPINYRTVTVSDFGTSAGIKGVLTTVESVAGGLNTTLTGITTACPHMSVSLAGYSLGAWIINYMLITYHQLWPHINSVVYYGDPCWYNSSGGYTGLAQQFAGGCASKSTYPYPASSKPFPIQSWCANKDPICGQGYSPILPSNQLSAAKNCTTNNGCTHLSYVVGYPNSGATVNGGRFLESHAF